MGVTRASSIKQRIAVLTLAESLPLSVPKALPRAKYMFVEWNRILRWFFIRCSYSTPRTFVIKNEMKLALMHSFYTCVESPTYQGPSYNREAGETSRGRWLSCNWSMESISTAGRERRGERCKWPENHEQRLEGEIVESMLRELSVLFVGPPLER